MATTYGARLNFRDTSAASCKGLVHGSCWPDAEEPGSKHDLEGKGATREMATSGFSYGKCKGHAKCVLMRASHAPIRRVGPTRHVEGEQH